MSGYNYETEKAYVFTDEGQRKFLKIRDQAAELFESAGAFTVKACCEGVGGDSWQMLACVDRLVELGEYRYIATEGLMTQYKVLGR